MKSSEDLLFKALIEKAGLKQEVYSVTLDTFSQLKTGSQQLVGNYRKKVKQNKWNIPFEFNDKGTFYFELKFGGDVLIFLMHTNIFEFSRSHEVMKSSYIREDPRRSYCGIIHIFNFLADSFRYNRTNDVGYLIGRLFINRERHYFIEGKKEIGLLFDNFSTAKLNRKVIHSILRSSIHYTLNFDLLTPPYENVKEVSVEDIQTVLENIKIRTGKRLGFRFQDDKPGESEQ
jgi:hypothetical protein